MYMMYIYVYYLTYFFIYIKTNGIVGAYKSKICGIETI